LPFFFLRLGAVILHQHAYNGLEVPLAVSLMQALVLTAIHGGWDSSCKAATDLGGGEQPEGH
jgi:hypothetical protein